MSVELNGPFGHWIIPSHDWETLIRDDRTARITRLIEKPRCMTPRAAAIVIDAAMFSIGCVEGKVRAEQQKRIDAGEKL